MDERLEKALEFANYRITLGNQKRTLKQRTLVLQTVHYANGVFHANPTTIAFVKTLIDLDKSDAINSYINNHSKYNRETLIEY